MKEDENAFSLSRQPPHNNRHDEAYRQRSKKEHNKTPNHPCADILRTKTKKRFQLLSQRREQVDRTPDAVAVIHEGQAWTYWQLDERANRLARHLHGLGAGPGTLVGVCMNRSADMVVAVLGILKAGADPRQMQVYAAGR